MLALNKEESEVKQLNVEPLWKAMMEQMAFPEEQLKNDQKWKTKQELLTLIETYYATKVKELNHTIEAILEKELAQFLQLTPCGSLSLLLEPAAKQARK